MPFSWYFWSKPLYSSVHTGFHYKQMTQKQINHRVLTVKKRAEVCRMKTREWGRCWPRDELRTRLPSTMDSAQASAVRSLPQDFNLAKSPSKGMPLNSESVGKVAQHRLFWKHSVQAGLFQATWRIILFPENQAFKSHQGFWKTFD